ncbi:MAG: peptidase protein, partial [Spirosoma sp.]|nr:peptidase protein [Spirosoma sp.]
DIDLLFKNTDRVGLQLSEWIATGDWRLVFLYRDALRKVTPADVKRVATAYFKPSNRTVGMFIPDQKPDRAEIPETPDVAALVKDYKGEAAIAAGEAFDVSPANIDARTKLGTAPNGLKFALLPKSTRGNAVAVQMRLRYGDEKSLMNKGIVADFTADMLDRGTKTRTYQQIKDEFDKLKARVRVYGNGQSAVVDIEGEKDNLSAILAVVTDFLKNPTFPQAEFDKLKQEWLAQIEAQKQEPQAIAFKVARRLIEPYPKGHPFYMMTFDEEIAAINALTLDEVKQFYRNFYGTQAATVAVVGAFDEPLMRKMLTGDLGTWKATQTFTRIPMTLFTDVKPQTQAIQANDKTSAVFTSGMQLPLRDDDPDYPALAMANYILGEGMLNSRLATRIRVKDGLSYGVGSYMYADDNDHIGHFGSYAIYNPENAEKFSKAFREEVEKMVKDGVTDDEVKAAKSAMLQEKQVERSQDGILARRWSQYLTRNEGRTFAYDANLIKKIESLTPQQVNAALKKYLKYDKLVMVQAGDFEKAAKTLADKKPETAQQPASSVGGSNKKN